MIQIIASGGNLPEMGGFLAEAFANMPPEIAQAQMSALFVNMVGNIPEPAWEAIKAAAKRPCECGDPHCGESLAAVISAGDLCREHFKRVTERPNPDEKGFSE